MAYVRDDIAMREYRQLLAEKADVTRTIEVALRRAREIKRELQTRKAFLPPIKH